MSAAVAAAPPAHTVTTSVRVQATPKHATPSTPKPANVNKTADNGSALPPTPSPPRSRHANQRKGQTRFEKEQAATGGKSAADQPGDPKVIGPWRIGKTIGKGASGRVKIAKHNKTGQFAAIKIIPKHVLLMGSRTSIADAAGKHDKALMGIEREIVIMKLIDHPNIMSLFDVWETSKELFLVLEYVEGGELFDYLVSQGRLHPDEASRYFQQIIAGVDYCHRFNICHRDLKPENLLLDADRNIKIADFGMAALEPNGRLLETSCGSPHYASPEIVMGLSYHGAASDIWSCGVILYALLTGRLPFDDENIRNLLQKVKNGRFTIPADLPADARDLIARMLVVHPERRITMPEIIIHPFFQRRHATESGKSIRSLDPPKLDLVDRPVRYEWEIDRDILRNLRALWSGTSDRQMVRALLSPERNMEKAFYFLLQQYRNKNLENYNADADSPNPGSVSTFCEQQNPGPDVPLPHGLPGLRVWGSGTQSPALHGSIMAADGHVTRRDKSRDPERRKERERRRREREAQREKGESEDGTRRVSRRASATSSSQTRSVEHRSATRSATTAGEPRTANRPAPAVPVKSPHTPSRRSFLGPRPIGTQTPTSTGVAGTPRSRAPGVENEPPSTTDKADYKSTVRLVQKRESAHAGGPMTPPHPLAHVKGIAEHTLPQITVQIPTPKNDGAATSPLTSPSPSPLGMPVPPELVALSQTAAQNAQTPTTPTVNVPSTPSPSPRLGEPTSTPPSSPPLGSISVPQVQDAALQKFFHDIAVQLQLISGASPRSSLAIELPPHLPALLQDRPVPAVAEGRDTAVSARTAAPPPLSAGSTADNTPIVTPLLDAPAHYAGVMKKEEYPGAKAQSAGERSVDGTVDNQPPIRRPLPLRAMTDQGSAGRSSLETDRASAKPEAQKRRSYVEPSTYKQSLHHDASEIPDVQPRRYSAQKVEGAGVVAKPAIKRKPKPAPLDLSPRVMQPSQLLSPNATPHMLSASVFGGSAPSSPLMIGPSNDGKQSWFSNLFSWKPAMFTLISADDCASSRAECIKLLESFGAMVVLEDADGWGVLKCKVDEIRDVSGIIISKSVRFRIEFLPHSSHFTATPRIAHERFASGISPSSPRTPMSPHADTTSTSSAHPHARSGGSGARTAPSSPVPRGRVTSGITTTGPYQSGSGGSASSATAADTTSMTMIQEKGALSAFKAVYGRIGAEWRLDSLKSPAIGSDANGTKLLKTPGTSPLPSPAIEQGQWSYV